MKKIVLWVAGILIVILLLAYGVFWSMIYFGMETPKDNDVIERSLEQIQKPAYISADGAISPAGEKHPGEIVHDDKIDGQVWTKRAAEVPQTIAWVKLYEKWIPVVRIEITGTPDRLEITSYGPGDQFLQTTLQAP